MHDISWKVIDFKSAEVSIIGYECGASMYPKFYYQIYRSLKPYHVLIQVVLLGGVKLYKLLKEKLLIDLFHEA